ncbi:nitrite reductase small subunit NirD [uncultured Litoreibacter sp.]|uniref:nitrite reductase small subunit NirD n=1 Tax=uncultured Litoreibacter sp. TaxID=1392394 RepID=UPI00261A8D22|nr:nitrite reductase small subunit NirD [uncultured Litoreibacter sp.]
MSQWIEISALDAIPQRGARLVKTPLGCVAVFRTATDEVYALDNACPHKGGPLADGIVHGTQVTCPLHNWVISLETGMAQGADEGQVATYRAKVTDGRIYLDTEFLQHRAVA